MCVCVRERERDTFSLNLCLKVGMMYRFAEMQKVWKKDSFLVSNDRGGKRKGVPSFHHVFSAIHTDSCAIGTR